MTYFITTPLKTFVSCIKAPESSKDGFSGSFCSSSFSTLPPKFLWRRSSSGGSLFTLVRWQRPPSWSSWWWRGSFLTSLLLFLSFFLDPWGDLDRDLCLLYFRSLDLDLDLILLQKEKPSSKKFQILEFWEEFVLTTSAVLKQLDQSGPAMTRTFRKLLDTKKQILRSIQETVVCLTNI